MFCAGSHLVIPTLYRFYRVGRVLLFSDCLLVVAVAGCSVLFPGGVLFAVCGGIVVINVWDFEWVICFVDVVPDRKFYEVYRLYLFSLCWDFCV